MTDHYGVSVAEEINQLDHDLREAAREYSERFIGGPFWQFKNGTLARLDAYPPEDAFCAWDRSLGRWVWYAR